MDFGCLFGQVNEYVAVLHDDGMSLQLNVGVEIVDSGFAIEGPGVPRTNDLIAVEIAVTQGAAGVRAAAIETPEGALVVTESVGGIVNLDLSQRARGKVY